MNMESYTLALSDPACTELGLAGGKGSNLAKLSQAGFEVPRAFIVSTRAYDAFIEGSKLHSSLFSTLSRIDFSSADSVEQRTSEIRALLENAEMPEPIRVEIVNDYHDLGKQLFVAVRSSGTAEDLGETSFAGQHDTYLDIHGDVKLVDAVKRCWASMWSARATAYRHRQGMQQTSISIAVVIQTMVSSDVSGVMFTVNPVTAAVDEIVVDAAWGLGEGIVSGILTPDQFVLDRDTLKLKSAEVGSKAVRVVRNQPAGIGTVTESVPAAQRAAATLAEAHLRELGALGQAVEKFYGGYPQDIEWAYANGRLFLLQSRDITGVEFSWDEDLQRHKAAVPEAPDTVWTRIWADMALPGAVTPLFYSIRAEMYQRVHAGTLRLWGLDEKGTSKNLPVTKYYKGRVYYNSRIDYELLSKWLPPSLRRPDFLAHIPREWHPQFFAEPWSWTTPLKTYARIRFLEPMQAPNRAFDYIYDTMRNRTAEADGLSPEAIQALSDGELIKYFYSRLLFQKEWVEDLYTTAALYLPLATGILGKMLENWYDGQNRWIANDLIIGLPEPTVTLKENRELWRLSERIRGNAKLRILFEKFRGKDFFEQIQDVPEAAPFRQAYSAFVHRYGHRGQSDRDIYGDRRIENPVIDYTNLSVLLSTEGTSPDEYGASLIARREAATAEVVAAIRRHPPFAGVKVKAFLALQNWLLRCWMWRDDVRDYVDRVTLSKKRAVCEVGRRLNRRGLLSGDDLYFLSKEELFELLTGSPSLRLTKAKIGGRRRNFERVAAGAKGAPYLRNGRPGDLDANAKTSTPSEGVLRGTGTSRGMATGIARIIPRQQDIGQVRKGEILITSATDPGWTPVFMVISGLVLETGGMLAHGSCISREYGIPAVQIADAMSLVPNGAKISVNGDTGEVHILEPPVDSEDDAPSSR